jgi:hypothetical protein
MEEVVSLLLLDHVTCDTWDHCHHLVTSLKTKSMSRLAEQRDRKNPGP